MFLVDWLSFTTKIHSLVSIIDLLGLSDFEFISTNGRDGYANCLLFNCINILYNGFNENMGIFVDMSGTGCRTFETYSKTTLHSLLETIVENSGDYNVTRLDVAFDEREGIIPMRKLEDDTRDENFVSKFRESWRLLITAKGDTVYQGSPQSDVMLRIYDKAAERKTDEHWIRFELQFRRKIAFDFIKQYINGVSLGELFCGVLHNYLRYIDPNDNPRRDRCKMRPYWKKLINNAVKVKLFTPCNLEYNLENLHNFVVKQAGGALYTYLKILGYDYLKNALDERKTPLNPKYKTLLSEAKQVQFLEGVGELI